ncbi:C6 transcription factor [Pleurostoma richardsiae]|uniref:C6 transcription factor n=1 Tax=Pleurostoma richardsiae TaxID=41990 RepID=A0AA38RH55_9PEZI|nr:C6 transcription factor [Pleurostoma richardsiae]
MVATRSSSVALTPGLPPTTPHRSSRASHSSAAATPPWSHTPTTLTLLWLAVSLPLVAWDTLYVLLRPHTMPGGALHWPLWVPYELYGTIDHVYGWKAWNAHSGFTAAQGSLNALETAMYAAYWYLWFAGGGGAGAVEAEGGRKEKKARRAVVGRRAAWAVLIGFSAAVMTVSKTVLYWLNEYFSGFDNIGHNSAFDLVFLWIIPNGAWIVLPSYLIYQLGGEIIDGLTLASGDSKTVKSE